MNKFVSVFLVVAFGVLGKFFLISQLLYKKSNKKKVNLKRKLFKM